MEQVQGSILSWGAQRGKPMEWEQCPGGVKYEGCRKEDHTTKAGAQKTSSGEHRVFTTAYFNPFLSQASTLSLKKQTFNLI